MGSHSEFLEGIIGGPHSELKTLVLVSARGCVACGCADLRCFKLKPINMHIRLCSPPHLHLFQGKMDSKCTWQTAICPIVHPDGPGSSFLQPLSITVSFSGPLPQHLSQTKIVCIVLIFRPSGLLNHSQAHRNFADHVKRSRSRDHT